MKNTIIFLNSFLVCNHSSSFRHSSSILALKPKPWLTAPGAFMILNDKPSGLKTKEDIIPLTSYRTYGGVIKGREEESSVAITNRNSGVEGYIRLNSTHEYFIERKYEDEQPITEVIQAQLDAQYGQIEKKG